MSENIITPDKFVKGIKIAKSAKRLLNIYSVLHVIASCILASIYSEETFATNWRTYTETNWDAFAFYVSLGIGSLMVIYTICNLLIQLYANTVATREAVYRYINHELEKDNNGEEKGLTTLLNN